MLHDVVGHTDTDEQRAASYKHRGAVTENA
jgi:hypothetical protein